MMGFWEPGYFSPSLTARIAAHFQSLAQLIRAQASFPAAQPCYFI